MTKTVRVIAASLFIFVVFHNVSKAQIRLAIGPAFGLTSPTIDFTGETTDFYNGTKYGVRSGINYGIMSKLALGPLNARLSISYASLSNTGKGNPNEPNSTLEVKSNLFMLSVGTELGFGVPLIPVRPYIGVDLLFSTISGSFNFQNTGGVNSNEISMQSASRTGLGLAIGSEFNLGRVSIDASIRYNLLNLFSKSYTPVTNASRTDAYMSLNDAADPDFTSGSNTHFISGSRTLATIQFQVGILFGF